jgi:DNA-damage-inducible protein D
MEKTPIYGDFAKQVEEKRRTGKAGGHYWMARDLQEILGYQSFESFERVILKARMACESAGVEPDDQFRQTTEKVLIGSGAERNRGDWFLTRYACYLIAMNGEPAKPQVGFAQTYFAIQTRKQEIVERLSGVEKRIEQRHRVTQTVKALNSAAKTAGVQKYALFHDAGYRGLYEMGLADIKRRKGLPEKEDLLDRAGRAELAAIEFKNTQTEQKIIREKIVGESHAIRTHRGVAAEVRRTIQTLGGILPEDLPPEESIKKIEAARKRKKLPPAI